MSSNKQRREEAMRQLEKEIKSRDRAEKTRPLSVAAMAAAVILLVVGGIVWAVTRDGSSETTQEATSAVSEPTEAKQPVADSDGKLVLARNEALADTVTCEYDKEGEPAKKVDLPKTEKVSAQGEVTITLQTSAGDIPLTLDRSVSPCTVNAIEHLAKAKYYDDTVCHRLTTSGIFVLQCGDPTGKGSGGPGFQFANEYPTDSTTNKSTPVTYPRGTIAMANAGEGTNGSQFFLNYQDSPLPPLYTYFGKIDDSGLKTLDSIAEAGVKDGQSDGAPAKEVKIKAAVVGK